MAPKVDFICLSLLSFRAGEACVCVVLEKNSKTKSAKTNIPRLINPNTVNSMRPYQQRETMTLREMNTNCQSQTVNTNQKLTSLWTHTVTNMDWPAAPLSGAEHSTHWHCSIQPSAHTCWAWLPLPSFTTSSAVLPVAGLWIASPVSFRTGRKRTALGDLLILWWLLSDLFIRRSLLSQWGKVGALPAAVKLRYLPKCSWIDTTATCGVGSPQEQNCFAENGDEESWLKWRSNTSFHSEPELRD